MYIAQSTVNRTWEDISMYRKFFPELHDFQVSKDHLTTFTKEQQKVSYLQNLSMANQKCSVLGIAQRIFKKCREYIQVS